HDKQAANKMGLSDGKLNDPSRRDDVESTNNRELLDAYDAGFADGKETADSGWDDIGAKVDAADIKPPSQSPVMSTYDKVMTGAGVLAAIISVLEAKGLIAKAGVGTTLGTLLLIPMGFKLGTDIRTN